MKHHIKKTIGKWSIMFFFAFFALQGCLKIPPYEVIIKNTGTHNFSHSSVKFNNKSLSGGWVSPGYSATYSDPSVPIPEKAIVTWRRENGDVFSKEVLVKSKLPERLPSQTYSLIFEIDENENVNLETVLCVRGESCPERFAIKNP